VGQTQAGEIKGKLAYMSPEQCLGQPLDQRSDIFSLGVVLYEWLTGYRLFTGDSEVAILKSITDGKIYGPSYFKPDIPPPVEQVVMRALEKDRERRYASAWEMQRDLEKVIEQFPFRPSSIHLSNFLKQLFARELEEERAQLARRLEGPAEGNGAEGDGAPLAVTLQESERRALESVAERHGLAAEELARDVLRDWLKYR